MITASGAGSNAGAAVPVILFGVLAFLAYWVPAIVARLRHVPNLGSVVVINAFLGWTLVGWVVALAMACRSIPGRPRPAGS